MTVRYIVKLDTDIAIAWIYDTIERREVRRSQDIVALRRECLRLNQATSK